MDASTTCTAAGPARRHSCRRRQRTVEQAVQVHAEIDVCGVGPGAAAAHEGRGHLSESGRRQAAGGKRERERRRRRRRCRCAARRRRWHAARGSGEGCEAWQVAGCSATTLGESKGWASSAGSLGAGTAGRAFRNERVAEGRAGTGLMRTQMQPARGSLRLCVLLHQP